MEEVKIERTYKLGRRRRVNSGRFSIKKGRHFYTAVGSLTILFIAYTVIKSRRSPATTHPYTQPEVGEHISNGVDIGSSQYSLDNKEDKSTSDDGPDEYENEYREESKNNEYDSKSSSNENNGDYANQYGDRQGDHKQSSNGDYANGGTQNTDNTSDYDYKQDNDTNSQESSKENETWSFSNLFKILTKEKDNDTSTTEQQSIDSASSKSVDYPINDYSNIQNNGTSSDRDTSGVNVENTALPDYIQNTGNVGYPAPQQTDLGTGSSNSQQFTQNQQNIPQQPTNYLQDQQPRIDQAQIPTNYNALNQQNVGLNVVNNSMQAPNIMPATNIGESTNSLSSEQFHNIPQSDTAQTNQQLQSSQLQSPNVIQNTDTISSESVDPQKMQPSEYEAGGSIDDLLKKLNNLGPPSLENEANELLSLINDSKSGAFNDIGSENQIGQQNAGQISEQQTNIQHLNVGTVNSLSNILNDTNLPQNRPRYDEGTPQRSDVDQNQYQLKPPVPNINTGGLIGQNTGIIGNARNPGDSGVIGNLVNGVNTNQVGSGMLTQQVGVDGQFAQSQVYNGSENTPIRQTDSQQLLNQQGVGNTQYISGLNDQQGVQNVQYNTGAVNNQQAIGNILENGTLSNQQGDGYTQNSVASNIQQGDVNSQYRNGAENTQQGIGNISEASSPSNQQGVENVQYNTALNNQQSVGNIQYNDGTLNTQQDIGSSPGNIALSNQQSVFDKPYNAEVNSQVPIEAASGYQQGVANTPYNTAVNGNFGENKQSNQMLPNLQNTQYNGINQSVSSPSNQSFINTQGNVGYLNSQLYQPGTNVNPINGSLPNLGRPLSSMDIDGMKTNQPYVNRLGHSNNVSDNLNTNTGTSNMGNGYMSDDNNQVTNPQLDINSGSETRQVLQNKPSNLVTSNETNVQMQGIGIPSYDQTQNGQLMNSAGQSNNENSNLLSNNMLINGTNKIIDGANIQNLNQQNYGQTLENTLNGNMQVNQQQGQLPQMEANEQSMISNNNSILTIDHDSSPSDEINIQKTFLQQQMQRQQQQVIQEQNQQVQQLENQPQQLQQAELSNTEYQPQQLQQAGLSNSQYQPEQLQQAGLSNSQYQPEQLQQSGLSNSQYQQQQQPGQQQQQYLAGSNETQQMQNQVNQTYDSGQNIQGQDINMQRTSLEQQQQQQQQHQQQIPYDGGQQIPQQSQPQMLPGQQEQVQAPNVPQYQDAAADTDFSPVQGQTQGNNPQQILQPQYQGFQNNQQRQMIQQTVQGQESQQNENYEPDQIQQQHQQLQQQQQQQQQPLQSQQFNDASQEYIPNQQLPLPQQQQISNQQLYQQNIPQGQQFQQLPTDQQQQAQEFQNQQQIVQNQIQQQNQNDQPLEQLQQVPEYSDNNVGQNYGKVPIQSMINQLQSMRPAEASEQIAGSNGMSPVDSLSALLGIYLIDYVNILSVMKYP